MSEIVIDTGVVSLLFKNHPISRQCDPEISGRVGLICFMTVAEMERWSIQRNWSEHRLEWLHLHLRRFTVVPSSPDLCRKWAEVMVAAQAAAPLVTHNRNDYLGVSGLRLIPRVSVDAFWNPRISRHTRAGIGGRTNRQV
jgi:predicted nucleic acid-binding protein